MSSVGFRKSSSTNCSSLSVPLILMAFAHYLVTVPVDTSKHAKVSNPLFSYFHQSLPSSLAFTSSPPQLSIARNLSNFPTIRHKVKAVPQPQDSEVSLVADAFTHFKHLLLPITDRNPYLSEGSRQAAATTAALAKNYGADITVVVIDEKQKEELPEHGTQLSSIRWHLSQENNRWVQGIQVVGTTWGRKQGYCNHCRSCGRPKSGSSGDEHGSHPLQACGRKSAG